MPTDDLHFPASPRAKAVVDRVSHELFRRPLVANNFRALLVEAMVAEALEPDWRWCSADYAAWDFETDDGLRLEVKQSAAKQSWALEGSRPSRASFDIAFRAGRYDRSLWVEGRNRYAHLYIFAHHAVVDASADHREPGQWRFYVTPAPRLPPAKTIGLAGVAALASPDAIDQLAAEVAAVRRQLTVLQETS